jgi:hypothetical protein
MNRPGGVPRDCSAQLWVLGGRRRTEIELVQARRSLLAVALAALKAAVGLAALGELSDPWFYDYALQVPATHPLLSGNLLRGTAFVLLVMPLFRCSWRGGMAASRAGAGDPRVRR